MMLVIRYTEGTWCCWLLPWFARSARPLLSSHRTACLQPHALVWFQLQRPLRCERLAGDQVGEAVACPVHPQLVGIHLLPGPISLRAVNPTTVAGLVRVRSKRVIVQRANLVAQVEQRDTADAQNDAVQHHDAPHGQLHLLLVAGL